jgi:hypothetical protein
LVLLVDYRETAAKFQKEWDVKQPHRDFAFARHVKSHALVSVINRGLLYHALEREHARNLVSNFRELSLSTRVFGVAPFPPPARGRGWLCF